MTRYERCNHRFRGSLDGGDPVEIRHESWLPIRHLYMPPPIGQEDDGIALFRGEFELDGVAWAGEVHFNTRKHPEPVASGIERIVSLSNLGIEGLEAFFGNGAGWEKDPQFSLSVSDSVPVPPELRPPDSGDEHAEPVPGRQIVGRHVGIAEIGNGDRLSRVSFLIPNGRHVSDGLSVCDGGQLHFGVTFAEAGGWVIRIDPRTDASQSAFARRQRETAAHTITHVGEIRRADGAEFSSLDVRDVIEVIETALTLYLGRATACVLPVGWLGAVPRWTRWGRVRAIDRRESDFGWFDEAEGATSLAELIRCCVTAAQRKDGLWELVQLAIGYLLSAHRSTVQMRVSLPLAAISLIIEEWNVSFAPDNERRSRAFMSKLGSADRFRMMLAAVGVSPRVPASLPHLGEISEILKSADDAGEVDAVKCIVALRNEVEHPGKRRHVRRDIRQWAEAGFFATDALLLSVLFLLQYRGTYLGLSTSPRGAGSGRRVPWAEEGEHN